MAQPPRSRHHPPFPRSKAARVWSRAGRADTAVLRLAATWPFDVCLLDHDIGSDAGIDALPRLAELAPRMRVIMVTANAQVEQAVRAISLACIQ